MLFKGTTKRKAYHILSRLEDVGGELNAYTTKEETAVHASFLKEHYQRAIELISDITFNSVMSPKEIVKEKDVVIEEINSYLDNPAELIFDDFEELIFADQPIGRNILGTPGSVKSFTQQSLADFISENYHTNQMVFCSVGNIPDEEDSWTFHQALLKIQSENKGITTTDTLDLQAGYGYKKDEYFPGPLHNREYCIRS